MATRPIRVEEANEAAPSLACPLGVARLELSSFGSGEGQLYPIAALVDEAGIVSVASCGAPQGRILGVEKRK